MKTVCGAHTTWSVLLMWPRNEWGDCEVLRPEKPRVSLFTQLFLRLQFQRILALQQEVCHILHTQTPNHTFNTGDTHTNKHTETIWTRPCTSEWVSPRLCYYLFSLGVSVRVNALCSVMKSENVRLVHLGGYFETLWQKETKQFYGNVNQMMYGGNHDLKSNWCSCKWKNPSNSLKLLRRNNNHSKMIFALKIQMMVNTR